MAFNPTQQTSKKSRKDVHTLVKEAEEQKRVAVSERLEKGGQKVLQEIVYYALPLLSIAIFIGILIWGTWPAVQGILNYRTSQKEKNNQIVDLDNEISSLKALKTKEYEFERDLAIIDSIVPSAKTEVVKFVAEIAGLSEQYNLIETTHETSELAQKLQEEVAQKAESETVAIIQIPTRSEYQASFEDMQNFLNALYNKDDFIIISELSIQGQAARDFQAARQAQMGEDITVDQSLSANTWTMEVTFAKYQFSKSFSEFIVNNLIPITTYPNEVVLEYIRTRYGGS